jgi:hypothetical protein
MFLTVVRGPRYSHFRLGIIDSKLNRGVSEATQKSKLLSALKKENDEDKKGTNTK